MGQYVIETVFTAASIRHTQRMLMCKISELPKKFKCFCLSETQTRNLVPQNHIFN